MNVNLIVSASRGLILSFLIKDSDIAEIKVEHRGKEKLVGSIFKGKVKRQAKSLSGVFLDIGLDKEAYLPLKEEDSGCCNLSVGSEVLVQIRREPIDDKGPKATCRISIPGKFLVYLPQDSKVFLSSKIEDPEKRDKLFKVLSKRLNGEGVIVRTCARDISEEEILEELERLRNLWRYIQKKAKEKKIGLIYEGVPAHLQLIRDHWREIREVVVDDREVWSEILAFIEEGYPELLPKIRYVKNIGVFFKKHGIDKALTKLFSKRVWLKGGGFLVIEETEAMTVIDVNSGMGCGETLEENALKTNLEATEEIVKQIKLRGIGGIVVIDFIDMKDKKNKEKVVNKLKELFADEGSNVHVYGLTHLGLLEMTRRKETPSVTKLLSTKCPYCRGRGFVKSAELILYEMEKELGYFKGRYLELRVNPSLRRQVENLLEKTNLKQWVTVKEECDVPLDYYEVFPVG